MITPKSPFRESLVWKEIDPIGLAKILLREGRARLSSTRRERTWHSCTRRVEDNGPYLVWFRRRQAVDRRALPM